MDEFNDTRGFDADHGDSATQAPVIPLSHTPLQAQARSPPMSPPRLQYFEQGYSLSQVSYTSSDEPFVTSPELSSSFQTERLSIPEFISGGEYMPAQPPLTFQPEESYAMNNGHAQYASYVYGDQYIGRERRMSADESAGSAHNLSFGLPTPVMQLAQARVLQLSPHVERWGSFQTEEGNFTYPLLPVSRE
ncbi:hypothetical protein C0989_002795 [Termitomyces sp. Mn162]|nr:hypothetical protein C0989_002795 [Termitomyces sp. Mn162]